MSRLWVPDPSHLDRNTASQAENIHATMLSPGTRLQERYQVIEVISQGGMSVVYLAMDEALRNRVALKELSHQNLSEDELEMATEQFMLEGQILASLEHPGLPRVLNFFEQGGRHYLVMDCIQGRTLDCLVRDGETPPAESKVVEVGIEIASILDYLHTHDPPVIFRDLKPSNVMQRDDGTLKLIDFGISKRQGGNEGTSLFVKGAGTPGYAPPEQYTLETGSTDGRSDVYALGATLYTLLTREVPPQATDRWMGSVPLVPPRNLHPSLSPGLDQVVLKMLELKPDDRHQSAREVLDDLRAVQAGRYSARGPGAAGSSPQAPLAAPSLPEPLASSTGVTLLRSGRHTNARRHYEALLEENPESPEAHMGMGAAWMGLGHAKKAFPFLRRGAELDAQFPMGSWLAELRPIPDSQEFYRLACWFLRLRTLQGHHSADVMLHLCRSHSTTSHGLYLRAEQLHRRVYQELKILEREGPDSLRRRHRFTLVVAFVLALLAGSGGWWLYAHRSSPAARSTPSSPRPRPTAGATRKPARSNPPVSPPRGTTTSSQRP